MNFVHNFNLNLVVLKLKEFFGKSTIRERERERAIERDIMENFKHIERILVYSLIIKWD